MLTTPADRPEPLSIPLAAVNEIVALTWSSRIESDTVTAPNGAMVAVSEMAPLVVNPPSVIGDVMGASLRLGLCGGR